MTNKWEIFIECMKEIHLEFIPKNKSPWTVPKISKLFFFFAFTSGCFIICVYQTYTRLYQERVCLSLHFSNLTQPLRLRHNFSFFNEASLISSSSVHLGEWDAVGDLSKVFLPRPHPRSFKSALLGVRFNSLDFLKN